MRGFFVILGERIDGIDIEKVNEKQWELFTNHHLGSWLGVQTGYDPYDKQVWIKIESTLMLVTKGSFER
jgi:hypothetical protein